MTDEMCIWIGLASAFLLLVMEPRIAKVAWLALKIILFVVIAASMVFSIGVFGIVLIGAVSSWLGRGKK